MKGFVFANAVLGVIAATVLWAESEPEKNEGAAPAPAAVEYADFNKKKEQQAQQIRDMKAQLQTLQGQLDELNLRIAMQEQIAELKELQEKVSAAPRTKVNPDWKPFLFNGETYYTIPLEGGSTSRSSVFPAGK